MGNNSKNKDEFNFKTIKKDLSFNNLILQTQQETSIDGILVVDAKGKIISYNNQFVEMWGVPKKLVEAKVDEPVLNFVVGKVTNPEKFLKKVIYLYSSKSEKSRDEIKLKDGRTFDRYSAPMIGKDKNNYGRVWYFRDISENKKKEEEISILNKQLKEKLLELEKINSIFLGRELKMIELKNDLEILKKRVFELEKKLK